MTQSARPLVVRALALVSTILRRWLFVIFEHLLPARSDVWCFATWPGTYAHTADNLRAVFEVVKNDASLRKVILRRRGQDLASTAVEGQNVLMLEAESVAGAYYLAVAKVVLIGFALSDMASYSHRLTRKHRIVQLWHGIPLKRIGRLFSGGHPWESETPRYAATVCSSERDREMMAAAFAPLPAERVWQTGLPRNDIILKPEPELPTDYRRHLDTLRARLDGRRLVLYAPTWRENADGIYAFSSDEFQALEAILSKHHAVFGVRGHANVRARTGPTRDARSPSLLFLNDFPDVNVILRITDVLVTDYSSIYIDFLITRRPILHFTYDVKDYVSERGFLYDLNEALAGQGWETFSTLLPQLDDALAHGITDHQGYQRAAALFHSHGEHSGLAVVERIKALASMP